MPCAPQRAGCSCAGSPSRSLSGSVSVSEAPGGTRRPAIGPNVRDLLWTSWFYLPLFVASRLRCGGERCTRCSGPDRASGHPCWGVLRCTSCRGVPPTVAWTPVRAPTRRGHKPASNVSARVGPTPAGASQRCDRATANMPRPGRCEAARAGRACQRGCQVSSKLLLAATTRGSLFGSTLRE